MPQPAAAKNKKKKKSTAPNGRAKPAAGGAKAKAKTKPKASAKSPTRRGDASKTTKAKRSTAATPTKKTKRAATRSQKTAGGKKKAPTSKRKPAAAKRAAPAPKYVLPPRTGDGRRYWLMKTEPEGFSIDDLRRDRRADWDGVRNYQSRNFMRDEMAIGDEVLIYHSSAEPSGVAGLARVSRAAAPDVTALDPSSKYFDPKATQDDPRWYCVQVEYVETFPGIVPLAVLKATPGLESMAVTQRGQRLSITPVTPEEFAIVRQLGRGK